MILFVHIPKTAGTSFREGISQILPPESILLDYGPNAPETDGALHKLYEKDACTPDNVLKIAEERQIKMICGHFYLTRYIGVFPTSTVISFVREPLQRCYSEFLHRQRHGGYSDSLKNFIQRKDQINLQSRFLNKMPEKGIVGISEYYAASLQMINNSLDITIPPLKLNCHRDKLNQKYGREIIPDDIAEKFYVMNKDDLALYNKYLNAFDANNICLNKNGSYLTTAVAFHSRQFVKKIRKKYPLTLFNRS